MARHTKPKPVEIFREETTWDEPLGRLNSTRQTFDRKQYNQWRANATNYSVGRTEHFFEGTITWKDAGTIAGKVADDRG